MALVELSAVEQRYRAVLAVQSGRTVTEVAAECGVSRQSLHTWIRRYSCGGLAGLADRSHRPTSCPHQVGNEITAAVVDMRRHHPRWGAKRIAHELVARKVLVEAPATSTVYRILVRHGFVDGKARTRRREDYTRWEREAPMQLWQMDIVGGVPLVNTVTGELREAKVVTGVDDHSRYCVIATVVARATGRAVCSAFAAALQTFGVPEEVLTDNGKQFTDRFGFGGEVLFDRICRDNGITHRLTRPASPTTTGKVERFHLTLRREFLDDADPFTSLDLAQAALDAWVSEYNTARPHQSLAMAHPADRFRPVPAEQRALLPLRLPAVLNPAPPLPEPAPDPDPVADTDPVVPDAEAGLVVSSAAVPYRGGPVEFDRVVPACGNMTVAGRQFWLGPSRAGIVVTFWADTDLIHLLAGGNRIKTLRSHLSVNDLTALAGAGARPAGPSPLPPAQSGPALEIERMVRRNGLISVGNAQILAAELLAGQRVGIRIEPATLLIFDLTSRVLLRTKPNHMTYDQARRLQGARPAGPPPTPSSSPIRVQRRASDTGTIVIAWQKLSLGRHNAGRTVTAHVSETTIVVDLGDDTRTFARTNTNPVRWTKAHRPRKAATVS